MLAIRSPISRSLFASKCPPSTLRTWRTPRSHWHPRPICHLLNRKYATLHPTITTDAMANQSEAFGNFDLVKKVVLDRSNITVSKWKSRVTGLSVVHLDYDAPMVNGYFVVRTEIFDDSGCPHTLEHLVFMGSEKYPHKGVLDLLANRGFSNGTNAWTDTDHTAYTVSTAGEQGFLQLLPIYVDHILYPTMTNAGYATEVHHINGQGEDSGVVYSEMQGRENTSGDLMALELSRIVNSPQSAYRSETGGLMEALRVLTPERIRQYHRTYYVPHNLCLIVAGKLSSGTESLLSVVQKQVEPSIIAHGQNGGSRPPGWKRPFLETPSVERQPLPASVKRDVDFPEKDESQGELIINFTGPAPTAFLERMALDILGTYLTSSAAAPLTKEFVEIESPLCTGIYFDETVRATRIDLPIYVASVPSEHLDTFPQKLKASLQRIVQRGFDMERMKMVLDRDERQFRSNLESSKGDTFSSAVISDFLYGAEDGSDLERALDEINLYPILRNWDEGQWKALLHTYYIEAESAVIVGKPSAQLAERIESKEKVRIAEQVKKLGTKGLEEAAKILKDAKAEHARPVPTEVLTSFPVPDVKSIAWIPVDSVQERGMGRHSRSERLSDHLDADAARLPFFVQYDHVESDFVSVHAYLSLDKLPSRLRPYIRTYLGSIFSLPMTRGNGQRLTHEEVVNKLDNDTVAYDADIGMSGRFPELLRISIKTESTQYETAVGWLYDLIYSSEFTRDRLAVVAAKVQQSLPELKRDGSTVLSSLNRELLFSEQSTSRASAVLPQADFIPKLLAQLQEDPEAVIRDFEEIRQHLTDPSGVRFSVRGNVLGLDKPRSTWQKYFEKALSTTVPLGRVPLAAHTLSDLGSSPSKKALVMSLPTIESSFSTHTTKSILGFEHPEYPILRVALEVLNATEGYLWRNIRGSGLAYGAFVQLDSEAGHLTFHLYRSSNTMEALEEGAAVIKGLVDGSVELESTTLDAAKSGIVYSVAKRISTASTAASNSFENQALKGVPMDHQVALLEKYQQVSKEDVLASLRKHFLPLFDAQSSVAIVVTAPNKVEEIGTGLAALGFEVEHRSIAVNANELGESDDEGEDMGSESDEEHAKL